VISSLVRATVGWRFIPGTDNSGVQLNRRSGITISGDSALTTASAEVKWMNGWSATGTLEDIGYPKTYFI
jgi:hypothetical protein